MKRLSFWVFQILAWGAYGLSTYLSDLPSLADAEMFSMLGSKLIRATLGMGLSLVLYLLYRRLLEKSRGIRVLAAVAVLASLLVSALWQLLYRLIVEFNLSVAGLSIDWSSFRMAAPDYAFVMLAWSAAYLSMKFWRYSRIQERHALEARALAQEAQFKSLSYQLNPHFLFNALNSIRALVLEDAGRARQMVTQLSDFLRYTLVSSPLEEIPLRDELEALSRYLDIERTRFEERLELSIDVDPDVMECRLPGLILHPLLENAIKHGISTSPRPLQVQIRARRQGETLRVEIANTGSLDSLTAQSEEGPPGAGIGLANVRGRLERLYPGRYRFAVLQDGDWVRATLEIESR